MEYVPCNLTLFQPAASIHDSFDYAGRTFERSGLTRSYIQAVVEAHNPAVLFELTAFKPSCNSMLYKAKSLVVVALSKLVCGLHTFPAIPNTDKVVGRE
jgi:hypothetical protein